ncbi:hypothetical protein BDV98DRAFT_68428 [Pterulicium gracile]|uniref:Uncharacterized protein n=1 Tax=Pterulicium gracile TaxID=1884261 RepID=A0A5C3QMQ1_9AGAR|nr:hypothetical protein BDV98DRAFT_68428 [Pterula gracilis]
MFSPARSLIQPTPSPSLYHDPFNRALYSSTPSSSSSRVDTPTASEPDTHIQIYIPPEIPDNLAYHIYKIQAELATTPAAPSLFFDSKGGLIMDAVCDAWNIPNAFTQSPINASLPASSWSPTPTQQDSALSLMEPHTKRTPTWLRSFTEGLRCTDSKRSAGLALDVIRGSLWNYDGYTQLIQWLCWKAAAPPSLENAGVTLFTANLADKFGKFAGQEAALSFLDHLEQGLIELCQSSWSSVRYVYLPSRSIH